MPHNSVPLIIVDNNLLDNRGHHLALARTLAQTAVADGRPVYCYTHKDFLPQELPESIVIRRVFPTSTYEVFAAGRTDAKLMGDFLNVLAQVNEAHGAEGGEVLFHTADAHVYQALARWFVPRKGHRGEPPGSRLVYHISTPYEMQLLPGAAAYNVPVGECIRRLAMSSGCESRYFFWAETERLAEYYRRAFAMTTVPLILPAPQWIKDDESPPPSPDGKLRLVFLGAARDEKGFMRLPALAKAIGEKPGLADKIAMRVQCSRPLAGFAPNARGVMDRLDEFDFVELVHGSLGVTEYAEEILNSDVVLMLYTTANYLARGSGIAIEALCSGKYLLLTRGMFVDSMDHLGLALAGEAEAEWVQHLDRLAGDIERARKTSSRAGAVMRGRYNAASYLTRLSRRVRFASHFRSLEACSIVDRQPLLVSPGRGRRI